MATYSPNYACNEVFGSRHEDYDDKLGLMKASVTLRIDYGDRHNLVQDICGNRRAWPDGAAGKVPLACQASIVPEASIGGSAGQSVDAAYALVTINYDSLITDVLSESIEPTAEFARLDHAWFRWGSGSGDPVTEEEAPGILKRGMNLVRHTYDVQGTFSTDYATLVGSTNQAAYSSALLNITFAIDTILYAAPIISRKVDSLNITKYDIETKFTYNPGGWNTFLRAKTATFLNIYLAGASSPYFMYPQADFSNILP